jgi:hypothetical protein
MSKTRLVNRRKFLQDSCATTASLLLGPAVIPGSALGKNGSVPPSKRVALGHIGVGGQGGGLLGGFLGLPQGQSVAVCDPLRNRRDEQAKRVEDHYASERQKGSYKGCTACHDFRELLAREDIDAVVIATPDHWHVPIALAAVRAGKDVYVEKPLGISIEQNKTLREAVHRFGAVFQYGTQQRCFNTHCAFGCELVRNGYIGELKAIHVVAPDGSTGGDPAPQPVPEGLDYDLWLGPAPWAPYTPDRVMGLGRWMIYDYALGFIAGWGAHPLDIAHWGYPHIPVEFSGTGQIPTEGLFNTIVQWNVRGRYASGVEFTLVTGGDKTTFVGSDGWVAPSRSGISAEPASLLKVKIKPQQTHLLQDNHHYRNFLDCVLTRSTPASDIDSAVQSDFMSHLADIAIRTGRTIRWDPERETIVADPQAERMMTRAMRPPWRL